MNQRRGVAQRKGLGPREEAGPRNEGRSGPIGTTDCLRGGVTPGD